MENYYNFNNNSITNRFYGGQSGRKEGIIFKDTNYLLKFPSNQRLKNINGVQSFYSNSTLSEYIGSHIYEILGIPVHKTYLGIKKTNTEHIVVACEDFNKFKGDKFVSFGEIKTTYFPYFTDSNGDITNGDGTDLKEAILTIETHPVFNEMRSLVISRFWQMFIIDCLINNSDRNNGNWGLIQHYNETFSLAPVFDNGGCLHNTWDDLKIQSKTEEEIDKIIDNQICVFLEKEKKINPSHFIMKNLNDNCTQEFLYLFPIIKKKMPEIENFINNLPEEIYGVKCCSNTKKWFYNKIIKRQFEKVFVETYSNFINKSTQKQIIKKSKEEFYF